MTKEIKLNKGYVAIVDDEDYKRVSMRKWYVSNPKTKGTTRYAMSFDYGKNRAKTILLHRFIMSPKKGMVIDHINRDGLDCRKTNMRECTMSQNLQNKRKQRGTSKYKGVYLYKRTGRWIAQYRVNGKKTDVGSFENEIDAAIAYDKAVTKAFGEYARTNKMMGLL